ncbi:hypothetical protein [Micromonospora yangpuensis]|uniref:Uncharacterized protein n=1 Tax=Micromonospora yangpuensis TaxID=683228 RepID=A0A1C6UEY3_9ACTN|nr:hypothetical protein [Micromonospora yangpuensis]GGM06197.1 hypothetical protein GCM10012279_25030 [Micromonospora yangpuensis]SCL52514.1 hypothetical protein GA0070617_2098 [Micromonospora yangpuensis]
MAETLRVEELRQVCVLLLDAVQERFGSEIDLSILDVDHYWNVDLRSAFSIQEDPASGIDVGQSSDDVAELRALLRRRPEDELLLWHDLQHLAGMLRLLAYLDLPAAEDQE